MLKVFLRTPILQYVDHFIPSVYPNDTDFILQYRYLDCTGKGLRPYENENFETCFVHLLRFITALLRKNDVHISRRSGLNCTVTYNINLQAHNEIVHK